MEFFSTDEQARPGMRSQFRGTPYGIGNDADGFDVFCHDFKPIYIGHADGKADSLRMFETWRADCFAKRSKEVQ